MSNKLLVGGIFCDLEKAFVCVNHVILFFKLKFYGISNKDLQLYRSYLGNRYCRTEIYKVSQNLCHKFFLGIPHPHLSKNFLSTWVQKWTGSLISTYVHVSVHFEYYIRCTKCWTFTATHPLRRRIVDSLTRSNWPGRLLMASNVATMRSHNSLTLVTGVE
jgi:hypothetical protein